MSSFIRGVIDKNSSNHYDPTVRERFWIEKINSCALLCKLYSISLLVVSDSELNMVKKDSYPKRKYIYLVCIFIYLWYIDTHYDYCKYSVYTVCLPVSSSVSSALSVKVSASKAGRTRYTVRESTSCTTRQ